MASTSPPHGGMLASGHGGRTVHRADRRCCRASPRSRALDDDNCCAHCVRLPAKERLISWKRCRPCEESVSCCEMCPLTEVLSQHACATAFGTTFVPIAVGLCARLPTVSATGLPAASCLGSVDRDFQCERTRTRIKNLSLHIVALVALTTAVPSKRPGGSACGNAYLPKMGHRTRFSSSDGGYPDCRHRLRSPGPAPP